MKIDLKNKTITVPIEAIKDYEVKVYINHGAVDQMKHPTMREEYERDLTKVLLEKMIEEKMVTFDEKYDPHHIGNILTASISVLKLK